MTRNVLRVIGCAIVVWMALASSTLAQVVINEVHYRPAAAAVLAGEDPARLEFVELYNSGANVVDLSGWTIAPAVHFTFPAGTSLAPGEYLVVARDPAFLKTRGSMVPVGVRVFAWSSGDLSAGPLQLRGSSLFDLQAHRASTFRLTPAPSARFDRDRVPPA